MPGKGENLAVRRCLRALGQCFVCCISYHSVIYGVEAQGTAEPLCRSSITCELG